jgi:(p)ppGpp synthase/HD superfamily hydrolase
MAMYQDRIFAFTPKGELIQLPKGSTPVDFAYAVHTNLGDTAVGAKVNGRVVPLRTPIENGDQVQILKSKAQEPQPHWLNFAVTGKARAAIRRFVRHKEQDELVAMGRKIYLDIIARLPTALAKDALEQALKRLKMLDEATLMEAIARQRIDDSSLLEALMPGAGKGALAPPPQRVAISIKGLTPGVAFDLAECCHPVPGDRIVGLRREDERIAVHTIGCDSLASGADADWLDLAWGDGSDGGTAQIGVTLKNEPGALAVIANIFGSHHANILNYHVHNRDSEFHNNIVDLEVHDVQHLMKIIASLRAADVVVKADRI